MKRKNNIGHHSRDQDFSPAIRHSSFVILILLVGLLLPALTFAQSSNRWLMIFDTSSSMRGRTRGTEGMVQDLLTTGMHGQVRHGDTIGIWTFNDKLHAGEAPLQVWSREGSQMILRHTMQYLDNLRYGRSANLTVALTNMYNVVDSSGFITVILFSDGDQPIKGTPFDDDINKQYKDNYRQAKKAGMPMITVFQAKHGNFTTNTVNFGPWPIDIPPVPHPPPPKPPVQPQAAPPAQEIGPPIIFDGRKSQSAAPDNSTLPPANNTAELAPPVVTQPSVTATPTETPTTTPTPPPVVAETPQPSATPAPTQVAANNQPESKPAVAPTPPPVVNDSQPPPAAPAETANKSAATSPPVETATSVPPPNLLSPRNIGIASVAFAAIVCGLLLMAARNARKAQSSLITRSLDREQH